MKINSSLFEPSNDEKMINEETFEHCVAELLAVRKEIEQGGGSKNIEKHQSRGKLFVRDRISYLLDPGSSFLEMGPYCAWNVYENNSKCGGMVCGIGEIAGHHCMILANDATVKGGTYYPLTVKKHLRAQEIALENQLPCIYLVDSGGAFLPLQSEVFPDKEHFGRIFYNQARMSALGIHQIAVVMGSCTAGGAYVPAMSDQTIIVKNQGTIFLGGPPLVKAATGEVVDSETLGGGDVHTKISGVADYLAIDDYDALNKVKEMLSHYPKTKNTQYFELSSKEPLFSVKEIGGLIPANASTPMNIYPILARLLDGSDLMEFKPDYGKTLVCGFARIHQHEIGVIANNGILFSESALKATHFIELCEQRKVPILFVQNIVGFMVGKEYEHKGIAKHGAKMVTAVASSSVPKITLVVGGSFGAGNYGMCGRAYGPRFLYMWPNAKISVMGGEQAADVLMQVKLAQLKEKKPNQQMLKKLKDEVIETFEKESSALYSSAHLWDDGIILPEQTRNVLALSLEVISHWDKKIPSKFGIFRM